jgi:signal transduction histidine kinase
VIGKDAASVFSAWPDLRDFCRRQGQTEGEFALGTPDRLRYFSAHVSPITRGTRPFGRLILLHDMTERREFSRRLIEAQENERRAIARELHDEAGQLLATLLLGLGSIQNHAPSPEIAKAMAELRGIADNVMQSLHRLAVDLRPVSLDRLGLEPALRQYTTTLSQQKNLTVSLAITDIASERLPPDVETTVYRVVQEALTNAVRHARATEIAVIIERRPATRGVGDRLIAIIEDNGEGFDPTTSPEGRLGLLGMRERAELANGTLSIESIPGHGTAIYLDLPWPVERG